MSYACRARALVGSPFRPQGRSPRLGLDCIGVIALTYRVPLDGVPKDYRLRGDRRDELVSALHRFFRRLPVSQAQAGDLLLCSAAADQLHLAVKTERGFVHADAGLRRVVETPGPPPWPIIRAFRRRVRSRN